MRCSHFVTLRARLEPGAPPCPPCPHAMTTTLLLQAFLAFFTASLALWMLRLIGSPRPVR